LASATLNIVQPNTQFQANGSEFPIPGSSVVAWNCLFENIDDTSENEYYYVWISAQDGSSLGGSIMVTSKLTFRHRPSRVAKPTAKSNTKSNVAPKVRKKLAAKRKPAITTTGRCSNKQGGKR
jgi:hypothetical protein